MSEEVRDSSDEGNLTQNEIQLKSILEKILNEHYAEDYNQPKLLRLPQSYGGDIIKFELTPKNSNPKLVVVAKMFKLREVHLGFICDMTKGYQNEICLMRNGRMYNNMAREFDERDPSEPRIVMFPELFENNDFFFMIDLKKDGYYNLDLLQGMDESHAASVRLKLVQFHAYNKLTVFTGKPEYTKLPNFIMQNQAEKSKMDGFEDLWKHFCSLIFKDQGQAADSRIRPYKQLVEDLSGTRYGLLNYCNDLDNYEEPWLTIVHGNLCGNNMMFIRDGQRLDVRFLDMVFSRVGNIAEELMFFIGYNLKYDLAKRDDFVKNWLTEYIRLFQSIFDNCIMEDGCCTYDNLKRECKKEGKKALFHCLSEILVFYGKVYDIYKNKDIPDSACVTRAKEVIDLFIHLGWINLP